jgi:hypothetical protein
VTGIHRNTDPALIGHTQGRTRYARLTWAIFFVTFGDGDRQLVPPFKTRNTMTKIVRRFEKVSGEFRRPFDQIV